MATRCVAREIGEDLRWPSKGSLRINDPIGLGCRAQQSGKRRRGLQRSQLAGESKFVLVKGLLQTLQEFSPEDHTVYLVRQEELRSAGNPALMIG